MNTTELTPPRLEEFKQQHAGHNVVEDKVGSSKALICTTCKSAYAWGGAIKKGVANESNNAKTFSENEVA